VDPALAEKHGKDGAPGAWVREWSTMHSEWSRRKFLKVAGGTAILSGLFRFAGAEKIRAKISDIQTMTMTGARTYVLVKVVTDDGHFGIAEAYGTPSIGVKEQIQALKPLLVGKNPLEIDAIYTYMGIGGPELSGTRTDGSAHALMRAASGIEMALWDLAGKLLEVPTTTLLGDGSVTKCGYTTTRRRAICWIKRRAASGPQRSRKIRVALRRTSSGFAIRTKRPTARAT